MDICKFFRQQQKEKDIDVALASKNQPSVELVFVVSSDDEERPDIPLPLHGKTNDELATKSSGKSSNDETPHPIAILFLTLCLLQATYFSLNQATSSDNFKNSLTEYDEDEEYFSDFDENQLEWANFNFEEEGSGVYHKEGNLDILEEHMEPAFSEKISKQSQGKLNSDPTRLSEQESIDIDYEDGDDLFFSFAKDVQNIDDNKKVTDTKSTNNPAKRNTDSAKNTKNNKRKTNEEEEHEDNDNKIYLNNI
ncbi:unnamed protein product [Gordionus sp. m RMFG-2023]